jgi:Clustered mitochondria/Translation initiation factor eIF3 subunit 135
MMFKKLFSRDCGSASSSAGEGKKSSSCQRAFCTENKGVVECKVARAKLFNQSTAQRRLSRVLDLMRTDSGVDINDPQFVAAAQLNRAPSVPVVSTHRLAKKKKIDEENNDDVAVEQQQPLVVLDHTSSDDDDGDGDDGVPQVKSQVVVSDDDDAIDETTFAQLGGNLYAAPVLDQHDLYAPFDDDGDDDGDCHRNGNGDNEGCGASLDGIGIAECAKQDDGFLARVVKAHSIDDIGRKERDGVVETVHDDDDDKSDGDDSESGCSAACSRQYDAQALDAKDDSSSVEDDQVLAHGAGNAYVEFDGNGGNNGGDDAYKDANVFLAEQTDASSAYTESALTLDDDGDNSAYVSPDEQARIERYKSMMGVGGDAYAATLDDMAAATNGGGVKKAAADRDELLVGASKDWNAEFRAALTLPEGLERHERMCQLTNDFRYAALAYAKIIISELPSKHKTLQPIALGGVAGGIKYMVGGILFKIARDTLVSQSPDIWMYGGTAGPNDEAAIRAASNELGGSEAYWMQYLSELHLPLISLITYRGFTIVAITMLPVDKSTLRYGSGDGGATVHAVDERLNELMETAADGIGVKRHLVAESRVHIAGPGDIEGHQGLDGRYYVLDFGRTLPPEAPPVDKDERARDPRSIFYKFLRREFVSHTYQSRRGVKLCSDAFTSWDTMSDLSVARRHAQEVRAATDYLFETVVPEFAASLSGRARKLLDANGSRLYDSAKLSSVRRALARLASNPIYHSSGINCRHIGRVRARVELEPLRELLLATVAARIVKRLVEKHMREVMHTMDHPSDVFRRAIVDFINATLLSPPSSSFWSATLPEAIDRNFAHALSDEERAPDFELRAAIDVRVALVQALDLLNVTLTRQAKRDLMSADRTCATVLDVEDIKRFEARIRSIFVIEYAAANRDLLLSAQVANEAHALRLLDYSRRRFKELRCKMPYCPVLSDKLGTSLTSLAVHHRKTGDAAKALRMLRKAAIFYETCTQSTLYQSTGYSRIFARYGYSLVQQAFALDALERADEAAIVRELARDVINLFREAEATTNKTTFEPCAIVPDLSSLLVGGDLETSDELNDIVIGFHQRD